MYLKLVSHFSPLTIKGRRHILLHCGREALQGHAPTILKQAQHTLMTCQPIIWYHISNMVHIHNITCFNSRHHHHLNITHTSISHHIPNTNQKRTCYQHSTRFYNSTTKLKNKKKVKSGTRTDVTHQKVTQDNLQKWQMISFNGYLLEHVS